MPAARASDGAPARWPDVAAAAIATLLAGWGAATALRWGVPLAAAWGGAFPPVAAGSAVSLGLALWALTAAVASPPRPRPGALAPLRMVVLGAVLGLLALLAFLQPTRDVVVALVAGGAGGAAALGLLALRGLPRPAAGALDLGVTSALLLLAAAEAGVRAWDRVARPPLLAPVDEGAEATLRRQRLPPGTLRFGVPINSRGDYDAELDVEALRAQGGRLVVSIGDSFANGVVPLHYHYTTVAERRLAALGLGEVEVYNMGAPAIGPDEYLHLLRHEALPLRPDAVVIGMFVGNDLAEAGRHLRPPPTATFGRLTRERVAVVLLAERLLRLSRQPGAAGAPADGPAAARPEVLRRRYPWLEDPTREEPFMLLKDFARVETDRARNVCGTDDAPYDGARAAVARMREIADVPLLVMVIPDEFQVEDWVWDLVRERTPGEDLDRGRPHRELGRARSGGLFAGIDLLPALRAVPPLPDGRRHVYHLHDTHFNARGNRAAGEALAEALAAVLPPSR